MKTAVTMTLIFAVALLPVFATTPLSTQAEVDAAFQNSTLIFRGTILASSSQWICGDEEISEQEAYQIEDAYVKHNHDHLARFGAESDEPAAIAHAEAWRKTAIGARFMKHIEGVRLVTVRFDQAIKGDFSKLKPTFLMTWGTGILQTCSHVGVSTEVGQEVTVFLREGWEKNSPAMGERYFLLGSTAMKPTKLNGATNREAK